MKRKIIISAICLIVAIVVMFFVWAHYLHIKYQNEIIEFVSDMQMIELSDGYLIDLNVINPNIDELSKVDNDDLKKIKKLDISFSGCGPYGAKGYDTFPPIVTQLYNLEYLNFSWNEISDLTPIQHLLHLKQIKLPKNSISTFEKIKNLVDLEYVDIRFNQLSDLKGIQKMKNLQYLNILGNQNLSSLQGLELLTNIQELHIGSDNLQTFPQEILYLKNLKILELYDVSFVSLPDSFFTANLPIEELSITHTTPFFKSWMSSEWKVSEVRSRPKFDVDKSLPQIHNLQNLRKLHLGWNNIAKLNIDFEKCRNLEEFEFIVQKSINIEDFFRRVSKAPNLKTLRISDNNIRYLTNNIALLVSIEALNLSFNKIKKLPLEITKLKKLKKVDLQGNPIDTIAIKKIEKMMVDTEFYYDK